MNGDEILQSFRDSLYYREKKLKKEKKLPSSSSPIYFPITLFHIVPLQGRRNLPPILEKFANSNPPLQGTKGE